MQVNQGPNYGITPETRPEVDYAGGARSARLTGRQGSSAQHPIQLADEYGYEQGEFEQKPKIVKDFAKAYMQVRILRLADLELLTMMCRWSRTWQARQPREMRRASYWLQRRK